MFRVLSGFLPNVGYVQGSHNAADVLTQTPQELVAALPQLGRAAGYSPVPLSNVPCEGLNRTEMRTPFLRTSREQSRSSSIPSVTEQFWRLVHAGECSAGEREPGAPGHKRSCYSRQIFESISMSHHHTDTFL